MTPPACAGCRDVTVIPARRRNHSCQTSKVAASITPGMSRSEEAKEQNVKAEEASRPAFARRVVVAVAITLGMLAVALFLRKSIEVLLLAFASILIAVVLRAMAAWVAGKTHMRVGIALAVVVL